jgi:hypothetical protein
MGSWRLNRTEDTKFPFDRTITELKENKLIEIQEHQTNPIDLTIEDEYDMDKLCGHLDQHKSSSSAPRTSLPTNMRTTDAP